MSKQLKKVLHYIKKQSGFDEFLDDIDKMNELERKKIVDKILEERKIK